MHACILRCIMMMMIQHILHSMVYDADDDNHDDDACMHAYYVASHVYTAHYTMMMMMRWHIQHTMLHYDYHSHSHVYKAHYTMMMMMMMMRWHIQQLYTQHITL